jgi:hypothetical protein
MHGAADRRGALLGKALVGTMVLGFVAWSPDRGVAQGLSAPSTMTPARRENSRMKIRLSINGNQFTASLADNATARDFYALLPMTLTLEDYAATEKISTLPRKLTTAGASAGADPSVGDIAYYAPWGNVAIYYKDFGYSKGLVLLGRLDGGIDALSTPGPMKVTIEAVKD